MIPSDLSLLRTPGRPAVLPDGTAAVVAVSGPDLAEDATSSQLWWVDLAGDRPARRLTRGEHDSDPALSPDGRWLAFVRGGSDGPGQVHLVEAAGGEPGAVSDAPLGASSPRFSPDGARLLWLARVPEPGRYLRDGDPAAEAPRLIDRYRYRADDLGFVHDRPRHAFVADVPTEPGGALPAAVDVTPGDVEVRAARWLPSGSALVVVAAVHAGNDEDLRVDAVRVDLPATPGEAPATPWHPLTDAAAGSTLAVLAAEPAPDGSALWLVAEDVGPTGREFVGATAGVHHLPLDAGGAPAGPVRRVTDEDLDVDAGTLTPLADGALVARLEHGSQPLVHVSADGALRPLVPAPAVVGAVAVVDAGHALVSAGRPDSAGDLLLVDLADGTGGAPRAVTDLSAPLRATGRLRVPEPLHATAGDGYPVQGWVLRPDPERFGPGPHPTVLMIHGGPHAAYESQVFDEVQVLAGAGYAVVFGNPRGSAGFGRAHALAIRRAMGTVDTDDVLALLDAALTAPDLDAGRVGVMGGSYGGYLTAWLTTRTHRFRAAVVERGFLDPVSFVGSSDIGWYFGLEYVGDVATPEGAALVAAQTPMAHVGAVRTPTLVIHSEQDWRCPVEQGQRWFVELKRRGVPTRLLLFPGEGHELTRSGRPGHRRARFEHVLAWWQEHLPVDRPAVGPADLA